MLNIEPPAELKDNPIGMTLFIAHALAKVWKDQNEGNYSSPELESLNNDFISPLPVNAEIVNPESSLKDDEQYESVEIAGICGLYKYFLSNREYTVVFENTLLYEKFGIDIIVYDSKRDKYILCETKGTTKPIKKASSYLIQTKKGLQLSWQWCWMSFCNMAFNAATAPVFIKLLPIYLDNNIERLLSISKCRKTGDKYTLESTIIINEEELGKDQLLNEGYGLQKHKVDYEMVRERLDKLFSAHGE